MRVRYRLPVSGRLRIDASFPVVTRRFTFSFEADNLGLVTHLNATAQIDSRALWPRITPLATPGPKFHVELSNPHFAELRRNLRAVSGLWALYGVDEITLDLVEEIWEPDTEEERKALPMYSFKMSRAPPPTSELPVVPFDLIARALIVVEQ